MSASTYTSSTQDEDFLSLVDPPAEGPDVSSIVPRTESRATLLVFTLGSAWESRRRRLLPAALEDVERALHERCLSSVLAAGENAGCRLLISSPDRVELPSGARRLVQRGQGFGERLTCAIDSAFSSSQDAPVLVVGTDSPDLGAEHLGSALAHLERDPEAVVLGPSTDGGWYLLASRRPLPGELAQVRWRRGDTLDTLRRALAASGREVILLEPLTDLDRPADLEGWLAAKSSSRRHETPPALAAAHDPSDSAFWQDWARRLFARRAALLRPAVAPSLELPTSPELLSLPPRGPPRLLPHAV